ncbi:MAG: hypothetical protein N3A38_09635 [Planctomycetota bacterium]|nr:hypothetical protein [Planctomycetota bacterium]
MKAVKVGLAVCALFVMFSAVSLAEDKTTVQGKVSVAKSEEGKVTVTLTAGEVKYVVAGEKAKDVEKMDGKTVKVVGVVKEEGGKEVITAESVEEVKTE